MANADRQDEESLRAEAVLFADYLLGTRPSPAVVERYVAASSALSSGPAGRRDEALLAACRRHPRALPFLDAAAGVLAPDSLLRRKLLVMAAILEATTDCAPDFLPGTVSAASFVGRLTWLGIVAGFEVAVGVVLFVALGGLRR